jgi:homoserine kinase type II
MAVFTKVHASDLQSSLKRFSLGQCLRLEGIGAGIENTNYFLDTEEESGRRSWVLTIFENMDSHELPFFVGLTRHLADEGLSVPAPLVDASGDALFKLHGKDAMIVPCLKGAAKVRIQASDCFEVGRWLASMHNAVASFDQQRPLVRDLAWMQTRVSALSASGIPRGDLELLERCVARYAEYRVQLDGCPKGTVHGDLFKDNVLFEGNQVSGVIDFYHACTEGLLFDLAVCANDWVTNPDGTYDSEKMAALLKGYTFEHGWSDQDEEAWPLFLELAALRFWISRLASKYLSGYQQDSVAGETIKEPNELRAILEHLLD